MINCEQRMRGRQLNDDAMKLYNLPASVYERGNQPDIFSERLRQLSVAENLVTNDTNRSMYIRHSFC